MHWLILALVIEQSLREWWRDLRRPKHVSPDNRLVRTSKLPDFTDPPTKRSNR